MPRLALLSNLQRSWSGWLIHWHTAELFQLLRLEADESIIFIWRFSSFLFFLVSSLGNEGTLLIRETVKTHIWCVAITKSCSIANGFQWWWFSALKCFIKIKLSVNTQYFLNFPADSSVPSQQEILGDLVLLFKSPSGGFSMPETWPNLH